MKKIFVLALLLFVAVGIKAEEVGIVMYGNAGDHFSDAVCDWTGLLLMVTTNLNNFGGGSNYHLCYVDVATDSPPSWVENYHDELPNKSVVIDVGHGNTTHKTIEGFATSGARYLREIELQNYFNDTNGTMFTGFNDPFPLLALSSEGMGTIEGPQLQHGVWKFAGFCKSFFHKDYYGMNLEDSPGEESYMGYPVVTTNVEACDDLYSMIASSSCDMWTEADGYVTNTMAAAFEQMQSYGSPILADGDTWNRWNDDKDCRLWADMSPGMIAYEGVVECYVTDLEEYEYLVLEGRYQGEWKELILTHGGGATEEGEIRHLVFGEPGDEIYLPVSGFTTFRIVAYDNTLSRTVSKEFGWTVTYEEPNIPTGTNVLQNPSMARTGTIKRAIPGTVYTDADGKYQAEWEDVGDRGDRWEEDCADIVVICHHDDYSMGLYAMMQAATTTNPKLGIPYRVAVYTCEPEFENQEAINDFVTDANILFNMNYPDDPHCYEMHPTVRLVGVPDYYYDGDWHWDERGLFRYWEEDDGDNCGGFSCRSHNRVTDYNDDGVPDGPLTVIPTYDYWQTVKVCDGADDWNDGRYVNDGAAFFLGDVPSGGPAYWYPRQFQQLRANMAAAGHPITWLLESEYYPGGEPDWDAMRQAGMDAMNAGVGYVVFAGFNTDQENHTLFLGYDIAELTRQQRVVGFGPTCRVGARAFYFRDVKVNEMMTAPDDGTRFVSIEGLLHDQFGAQGTYYLNELAKAWENVSVGDPMDDISFPAQQALATRFPKWGMGATAFRATVMVREGMDAVGVAENIGGTLLKFALPYSPTRASTVFSYYVPEDGEYELVIYDVRGREVDVLVNGFRSAGDHSESWNHRGIASGVYLAQLRSEVEKVSQKVLVLH